ncbi:hypothetical protein L2E82_25846 [Cichorium intybus]|uniref:Uncharacterized protein n=1 Tax=Cichorium intybus TaxID=13427 RepID=A0ACB9E5C5_CICIN|nr:hypothetical protein L2E82_25846 [Cichorium intybus]
MDCTRMIGVFSGHGSERYSSNGGSTFFPFPISSGVILGFVRATTVGFSVLWDWTAIFGFSEWKCRKQSTGLTVHETVYNTRQLSPPSVDGHGEGHI